MGPSSLLRLAVAFAAAVALPVLAAAPAPPAATFVLTLDGVALAAPPRSGRILAPTLHYDPATRTLHLWVLTVGEPGELLHNMKHATSVDGIHFTSTGSMSYVGTPWAGTPWGTIGEPAMIYPRIAVLNGRYKLLNWTYNAQAGQGPWGDYNYNINVNDIGTDLNHLAVTHEGPLGPGSGGIPGQTAGAWGVVNNVLYFENNFFIGRAALTELPLGTPLTPPSTGGTGPYRVTGTAATVFDLVHSLPAPLAPAKNCFDAGTPTFYVHNAARVLANPDGTLGIVYSVRDCATGARVAPELFYTESADNGLHWSPPVGIFNGAPVLVNGVATTGKFAVADVFVADGLRYVYFSTTDAGGNLVVVGAGLPPPSPPVATVVPVNNAWALALVTLLLAALGIGSLRRGKVTP